MGFDVSDLENIICRAYVAECARMKKGLPSGKPLLFGIRTN